MNWRCRSTKLFAIIYLNLEIYYIVREKLSNICSYFIPSSEFNAYLMQIKVILSTLKKYRIFSLVTNTIFIFSLQQTEAVSTI